MQQPDFSEISFNKDRQRNGAALQAAQGLRLLPFAIVLNIASLALGLAAETAPMLGLAATLTAIAGFAFGAYGIYLCMDGFGWAGYINILIVASLLVPYVKIITLVVVFAKTVDMMRTAGYRFTLAGKIVRQEGRSA